MDAVRRPKIGELLVASGLVGAEAVERALSAREQLGGVVGEHLVRQGAIDEAQLMKALSRQTGLQHVNLRKTTVTAELQGLLRFETVKAARVLPVAQEGKTLVLGMMNPADLNAERRVEEETRLNVRPVLLAPAQFADFIAQAEERGWGREALRLEGGAPLSIFPAALPRDLPSMLAAMVGVKGQDLYLSAGAIPAARIDNELHRLPLDLTPGDELEALVLGALTPVQRETFASRMELDFAWTVPDIGRFRCNVYRQRGAICFTARHVRERVPGHDELGLPLFLREFGLRKQGLVLIVGPTGHGKSTTLACMIDQINRERHANIITIEDPVEYVHHHRSSNVNQREVGTDTRSFAEGLRHAFRQAPDVLVIGEIRDQESAEIALAAAETGHLVLATMHALNATAAVDRLVDLHPAAQQHQARAQLAEALLLVFSQRLLRRARSKGRALAHEKMVNGVAVRNAIREGRGPAIRAMMQSNLAEVSSIDQSLVELVVGGQVTHEEAAKYCDSPSYFEELLKARGWVAPAQARGPRRPGG